MRLRKLTENSHRIKPLRGDKSLQAKAWREMIGALEAKVPEIRGLVML